MNCYEILEVSPNASQEVIKAAYKSLMQRYHPDKNPDNTEIAEHASRVVQAYEVLSDSNKRAAYDATLQSQFADAFNAIRNKGRDAQAHSASNGSLAVKDGKPYWLQWLLIALTILACLFALSVLKNKQSSDPGLKAAVQQETGERANETAARTIPKYITELSVELRSAGGYSQDSAHVIFIPVLGAKVGALDAEKVMRYIESNKELIRQKLEEKLVDAQYDELIKIDGEQYLKNMILESIGDTTGTNKDPDSPLVNLEVLGQYGVVEILLPRSFSVH